MNNLYINKEGYLCAERMFYETTIDDNGCHHIGKPIGYKEVKYKVNKDGLFEEIKDVK